jgi:hypothetical protein
VQRQDSRPDGALRFLICPAAWNEKGTALKKGIVVIAALFGVLAITSGAFAAHRYLITSSKQIKNGTISRNDLSKRARKSLEGQNGAQGSKGDTGQVGAPGRDGKNGPAGARGPQGLAGAPGPKGDTGLKGDMGPAGAPGRDGNDGLAGATGPQGLAGAQGLKGDTGPRGPKGDSGVNSPLVFGPYNAHGADSGFCGNDWANDDYTITFVVAPESDGSFQVSEIMKGSFKTVAGDSPNDCSVTIDDGITGSLYGDFVVPVASGADFNPTATLDDSTPCGVICTSNKFFENFFGESDHMNSTNYAWAFHYTTPGDAHGHWADTDHTSPSDPANGNITN